MRIISVVLPTEPRVLRSTQPLNVSTRDSSWDKGSRCARLTIYHPCSAETSRQSGALIYPAPLGPPRPVAGELYSLLFTILMRVFFRYTRVGTLTVATIYLQMIQNRYMFRSFAVLQCSHQHCVQPVASDVEVVGYL